MSASFKEQIELRVQDGARILALIEANAQDLSQRIEDSVSLLWSEDQVLDLIRIQTRLLEDANARLTRAYRKLENLSIELPEGWHSQSSADELELTLWHSRGRIDEAFGVEMLRLYGLDEPPPAGFRSLATYAHNTITLLQAHPQTLRGQFGDELDTDTIAQKIEAPLNALNDFLSTLDAAPAELKSALQVRDSASDHWMRTWRGVSTLLESLCLLAHRDDLAAQFRPTFPVVSLEGPTSFDVDLDAIDKTSNIV